MSLQLLCMCFAGKEKLNAMLADVVGEISIKQKLIDELESTQKRLRSMRAHYEEKLCTLANKIRETELERDKVLANLSQFNTFNTAAITMTDDDNETTTTMTRVTFFTP